MSDTANAAAPDDNPYAQWAPQQSDDDTTGSTTTADDNPYKQYASAAPAPDDNPYAQYAPDKPAPEKPGWDQSGLAAAARGFVREALPTTGGVAAGLQGAGIGARLGAAAGPWGALAGGIAGGVIAGFGGAKLVSSAQDAIISELGLDKLSSAADPFSTAQTQKDIQQHPYWTKAGELGAAGIGLAVDPGAAIGQRLASAGVMGGSEAAEEGVEKGVKNISPTDVAAGAITGFVFPKGRGPLSRGFAAPHTSAAGQGEEAGTPNVQLTQDRAADKQSVEPANDLTTVAPGIAAENAPAPKIESAGNQVGAPMSERTAARPDDPTRDYSKQPTTTTQANPIVDGIDPATKLAITGEQPQVTPQAQSPPTQPQAPKGPADVVRPMMQKTRIPPEEEARMQREALDNIRQNQASQQLGEDYPQGQEQQPQENQPVVVQRAIEALKNFDNPVALQNFQKLPPPQQVQMASRLLARIQSKTGEANGPAQPRVPSERPTVGDVTANSRGDMGRKKLALQAAQDAYDQHGPSTNPALNIGNAQDIAKAAVQTATETNNGKYPIYSPRNKPPAMQWLAAARKYMMNPNSKNLNDFLAAHSLQGETGKNVDAEIANKPQGQSTPDIADQSGAPHESFELLPPATTRTGEVAPAQEYVEQQNKLRSWLNDLPNDQYENLQAAHGEPLRLEVENSGDPGELHSQLLQELAQTSGKKPPKVMGVTAEEGTPVTAAVKNRADLEATEPGAAANAGRRIDPNSPEGKAIAEQALGKTAPDRTGQPEAEQQQQTVSGGLKGQLQKFGKMMKDEAGGGPLLGWMRPAPTARPNPLNEDAKALGDSLGTLLNRLPKELTNAKQFVQVNAASYPDLLPSQSRKVYRAFEDDTVDQLPPLLKQAADAVAPIRAARIQAMQDAYDMSQEHPELNMKVREPAAGVDKDFVPRLREGEQFYQKNDDSPFVSGRDLKDWAGALEDREYFSAKDAQGNRYVMRPRDDGKTVTLFGKKNDATLNSGEPTKIGSKINVDGKDYTVDHATAQEITAAVKDENGDPVKYIENPLLAEAQSYLGIKNVLESQRLMIRAMNDYRWQPNTTTKASIAKDNGWKAFPDFVTKGGKTVYGADPVRWAFEDYQKPGIPWAEAEPVRRLGQGLIRSLFAVQPLFHVLNVGDQWVTARGFDWVNPKQYRELVQTVPQAIRSVLGQDAYQARIRSLGAPVNYGGTLTENVIPNIAKNLGVAIAQNPSKWDPIARVFGMSTPDLANTISRNSNKITWGLSDMLVTQRIMENERKGMSTEAAIAETKKIMSSYETMPTVLGRRMVAQVLHDPAVSMFAPYHLGLWKSSANMINAVQKGTPAERKTAIGQLMTSMVLLTALYPLMDKGVQALTGNKEATFGRRGMSTIPDIMSKVAGMQQHGADVSSIARQAFTPSIPLDVLDMAMSNKDEVTGKPVIQEGASLPKKIVQGAEGIANKALPPYQQINQALRSGQTVGEALRQIAGAQIGIKEPSPRTQKYLAKEPAEIARDVRQRAKNPPGIGEALYNSLTR